MPGGTAAPGEVACAILSVEQMSAVDRYACEIGTSGNTLMERAGAAVAGEIRRRYPVGRIAVLCGPGNNGGDGFVAARLLAEAGWQVRVALSVPVAVLHGDALTAAQRWTGGVEALLPDVVSDAQVVVDALFGAGLSRPLERDASETLAAAARAGVPLVAVDVPSGVAGNSGADLGASAAALTVTFFRRKPAHLLFPGRRLCGEVVVADLGIPPSALTHVKPDTFVNDPLLWRQLLPVPTEDGHKYQRGQSLIVGGYPMTGAARLAARGAARVGSGLTSVAVAPEALPVYAAALTSIMVVPVADLEALQTLLADQRMGALLIGPGAGRGQRTRQYTLTMLATGRPIVLDADALNEFQETPDTLFQAIVGPCVLTPHEGEYARLFASAGQQFAGTADKLVRARGAAGRSGAVVVLKGADTVIASPDGRAAINVNAPPALATAGAGDVLAGMITGLMAQGMDPFAAACAAVWLHGAAAGTLGPGLMAEDLTERLPRVLGRLLLGAA